MRVFVGPTEVAGYYSALVPGLRAVGIEVVFADFSRDRRGYANRGAQHPLARAALALLARQEAATSAGSRRLADAYGRAHSAMRFALLLWAALRCDAFIYAFGGSITWRPEWEYGLLRRLGRRLVFVFHGSDSRAAYFGTAVMTAKGGGSIADCVRLTAERKAVVSRVDRFADAIIDAPLTGHLHDRPFVNWHAIGIPFPSPDDDQIAPPARGDGRVRVLHCPSAPEIKGTDLIRRVIAALVARGLPIDYVELTGRPHAEVIAEIRNCDFVVDQAYCETPMAGFATEAAAYGRAAVVGGYAGPHFATTIAAEWMPPVAWAHPDELESTIERLVVDEAYRLDLGRRAREFVRRDRSPDVVARRVVRVLKDDVPAEWMFDPSTLTYVNGFGDEQWIRSLIRGVVELGGPQALQLDHSPAIRDRVLAFAGLAPAGDAKTVRPSGARVPATVGEGAE